MTAGCRLSKEVEDPKRLGSPVDVEFQERLSNNREFVDAEDWVRKTKQRGGAIEREREGGSPQNRVQMCVSQRYGVICSPSLFEKK